MSISDAQMPAYFQYTTAWPPERTGEVTTQLASGELHPNQAKRLLARTVVDLYHGDGAGSAAEAEFDRVFKDHDAPAEVPDVTLAGSHARLLSKVLVEAGVATSNREAVRAIEAGSVKIDGEVAGEDREVAPAELEGRVIQVGRRKWARIHSDHAV
jgi:tyrosyl-tRNA synthetase